MSPEIQAILAPAIVAAAGVWLIIRLINRRRHGGCGGDCGCPPKHLKRH
jgi:hypothetical protein